MTVETETFMPLEEYKKLSRKLIFNRRPVRIIVVASPVSFILLCLYWFKIIDNIDPTYQALLILAAMLGLAIASIAINQPEKVYLSNKMLKQHWNYMFDEEKISYKIPGANGNIGWEYITKYETAYNYLVLYASARHSYIINTDKLNAEQINFIKSKIKIQVRFNHGKTNN